MLDSIWQDVKREYSYGHMVTRLIIINVAIFVVINLVNVALYLASGGQPVDFAWLNPWLCMSSDWHTLLWRPWTIFTSMFLHAEFGHILWNMLFFYWFGRIVGDLIGDRHILPMYLTCGLGGAIAYFISANTLAYGLGIEHFMLGASGAIMGITVASAMLAPDYIMNILFIGPVKLKYVVAVLVFLDLIFITNNNNSGGHFCHLGGAATGWFYISQLREGNDFAAPINRWLSKLYSLFSWKKTPRPKVVYKNPNPTAARSARGQAAPPDFDEQARIDAILDKIKSHGYEKLTAEEKEILFKASKK